MLTEEDRKFMTTEQVVASQMLSTSLCDSSMKYLDMWEELYVDKEADKAVMAAKRALLAAKEKQKANKKKKQEDSNETGDKTDVVAGTSGSKPVAEQVLADAQELREDDVAE